MIQVLVTGAYSDTCHWFVEGLTVEQCKAFEELFRDTRTYPPYYLGGVDGEAVGDLGVCSLETFFNGLRYEISCSALVKKKGTAEFRMWAPLMLANIKWPKEGEWEHEECAELRAACLEVLS